MSLFFGAAGGGGGGSQPNRLIATSGKWLSICVGLYAAVFWTVDIWTFLEPQILEAIYTRYEGSVAAFIYWLLRVAAYPLVFFAVQMSLGITFVSLVTWIVFRVFGKRP